MKHLAILCLLVVHSIIQAQPSDFGNIDFHKADSIAEVYDGESLEKLPLLAHHLTRDLDSDVEKARAVAQDLLNETDICCKDLHATLKVAEQPQRQHYTT